MRYILAQIVAARHVFAIKKNYLKNTELKLLIENEFSRARTKSAEQLAYIWYFTNYAVGTDITKM
jgi:hypothetical protein